jgi:hypothetical protein
MVVADKCSEAPLGDGAPPELITAVAGSANAVTAAHYTTFATLDIPQHLCHSLVTWLRCHASSPGFFASGKLHPVGLWDLRTDATPLGMLRCGEVQP